jgi:AsmA-like C-terminal region
LKVDSLLEYVQVPSCPWRPRSPVRRPVGPMRRWIAVILMVLLWAVVGAYVFLTNKTRVRNMASDYLADLLGARVEVGGADLSLFEGLRLDHVVVRVDAGTGPQSTIFEADTVFIKYNLRRLLTGKLVATQIIAVNARASLAEDVQTGQWNYQKLGVAQWLWAPWKKLGPGQGGLSKLPELPELLLRDAQVQYVQSAGGNSQVVGWMALDGSWTPLGGADEYEFSFQSRGRENLGPTIAGEALPGSGVQVKLTNFVFGQDIKAMLPAAVRQWCQEHALAGRMDVTVHYKPNSPRSAFYMNTVFEGVNFSVTPRQWNNPVLLTKVSGQVEFTDQGISSSGLTGYLENNPLTLAGRISGYSPDAPAELTIQSAGKIVVPEHPSFVASMPLAVRKVYEKIHPVGECTLMVHLDRAAAGGPVHSLATIDLIDGGFTFDQNPYPIRHATGQVRLEPDPALGYDVIRLVNIRGRGMPGPNENARITVDGWIGPLEKKAGGQIVVRGENIHSERLLTNAMPPPARAALELFDADKTGNSPTFVASFVAHSAKTPRVSENPHWPTDTDITFSDGTGSFVGFPYPFENAHGQLHMREGYVIVDFAAQHGATTISLLGRVGFHPDGTQVTPDLKIAVNDLPVDKLLLAALAPEERQLLERLGAAGRLDVDGRLMRDPGGSPLGYDLNVKLTRGSLKPVQSGVGSTNVAVAVLAGHLHLLTHRVELVDLTGRRVQSKDAGGDAMLSGHGFVEWDGQRKIISVSGAADNLNLDPSVRRLMPENARPLWDQLGPAGTADATLSYDNRELPSALAPNGGGGLELTVHPRRMSAMTRLTPLAEPYQLDDVGGQLVLHPGAFANCDLTASHGNGKLKLSGKWNLDDPHAFWDLSFSGQAMNVDKHLLSALPEGAAAILREIHLRGNVDIEFSKLFFRPAESAPPGSPGGGPDADFDMTLNFHQASMEVGVPMRNVVGMVTMAGTLRRGNLEDLTGDVSASSLMLAGRPAHDLHAVLSKPVDRQVIELTDLQATVADGALAGEMAVSYAGDKPSRYALSLVLHDADVKELTGLKDPTLAGAISASLDLSGDANDPTLRQGHGDVLVRDGKMYQLPLLLGMLQVTNLSLPISSPFKDASARYSVDGQRVILEHILLKNDQMTMRGQGHLDFDTKKVDLTFSSDNSAWPVVPFIGNVFNSAKNQLLTIHVTGTLPSPQVTASSLDSVTSTVDQVLTAK